MGGLSDKDKIRLQFDSYVKKVIKRTVINYYKERMKRDQNEVIISSIPEYKMQNLCFVEDCILEGTIFEVCNTKIIIFNENLIDALYNLKERQRDIILMSYCLEMSDNDIGKFLCISRNSVYRNRIKTRDYMYTILNQGA